MATINITFDESTKLGRRLQSMLSQLRAATRDLPELFDILATMVDGNGSDPTHFTEMTTQLGFGSNDQAKALYDSLYNTINKITVDSSVTNVDTTVQSLLDRTGTI